MINSEGEEVDDLDFECEECGSKNGEAPDEDYEAISGMRCLDCGWFEM